MRLLYFLLIVKILSGRGDRIRTYDLFVPNEARYRAALHPENREYFLIAIAKIYFFYEIALQSEDIFGNLRETKA